MKIEEIVGEKQIVSSGDCKTKCNGNCENCNWVKIDYLTVIENEKSEWYECITECDYISHMIVTTRL